ncbi:MAG: metalloprotease PmbA [Thiotrichales bacterium]|nr:metalloprotease PmbA [Thiotrichales bacterium]
MSSQQPNPELYRLIETIMDEARQQGATAAEAEIGTGNGLSVTVRLGELEKIEHERDKALGITVYMDQRKGTASSSDFSLPAIRETVTAACNIARFASEDSCAGLADAELMATAVPDLELHFPWDITPEAATALAIECETAARDSDARISNSDGCMVNTYSGEHVYGNTHGFTGGWCWSSHMLDCTVIAGDEQGMQRDGWYSKVRDHAELESAAAVGREAARRTLDRLGSRQLTTRSCPVLFEAPVAGGLFSAFITAISGSALYRGASFLKDSLGDSIFPDHIHIIEQPHLPKALGSAPFDNDGLPTRDRDIILDGVLQTYILSAYSARKLNLAPTGNAGGGHNLIIESGEDDLDALIREMDTGLLITDMIGFGVNQVTGDYSRGASGFWVEHGELQYPVEEITVAGNLKDIYTRILRIGNDVDPRGNIRTGSVLVESMTVAGN